MTELKEQIFPNWIFWKQLCLCSVALGLSYSLYQVFKQKKENREIRKHLKRNLIEDKYRTEYTDYYIDKNLQIRILEETLPQHPSIQDIYLNSPKISIDQFLKYTKEMRKRRRLIRKINEDQYINIIITYDNQIQQLLKRSRLQLVEYLNISPQSFTSMEENYQSIEDLHMLHKKSQALLQEQLLNAQPKKMSSQKLKMIIEEEIGFVQTKMYERIKNTLELDGDFSQNQILTVINCLKDDIIYEKYGYEREHIDAKIKEGMICTQDRDKSQSILQADITTYNLQSSDLESYPDEMEKTFPTLGLESQLKPQEQHI